MSFDVITESEKGRVRISVTALNGSLLTVTRRHPSGRVLAVRGMDKVALSGGAFLGWDYEMPVNVEVTYVATTWADPSTILDTSDAVTLTWTTVNDWLKDPFEPIRNMPIRIVTSPEYSYDTPTAVHNVLGRPDAVTIGDIRRSATGDLSVVTFTHDERERFHLITSSGHPLLVQSTQTSGMGNLYIAATGLRETSVTGLRDETTTTWTLSFQEVGMPVGDAAPTVVYQDLLDLYSGFTPAKTYQNVEDDWHTYDELYAGIDTVAAPPTLAWRGA